MRPRPTRTPAGPSASTPTSTARAVALPVGAALTLGLALLAGCASGSDWSQPHPGPVAVGALAVGFVAPDSTPSPEATIVPEPGSWDAIGPREGYRVVLVTSGDDAPTQALVTAVQDWAQAEDVDLRTIVAEDPDDLVPSIAEAVALRGDLVISAGDDLVDPLAVVSANHLDQQFLVVGAEIAEPTGNVTAADWSGASFRGEGLGSASTYDPDSFTPERCATALRAGVAAVLGGVTGVVVWVD
ncbi:hypothetical protein [Cellulomonas soli]|uniref:BMP family ABC transporter substrate-binding protein n=1 Tax=Cellulomonas soli TaxID=931535 RepID=A0A512PE70_9CELL|nr:hypothetical protein [Cellulomonas soli]NYI59031.1 hypothetical protein [Cellulomonas soli]GEP69476.1 hypothetical protein CSO01_21910 [Cellulomonas soli]